MLRRGRKEEIHIMEFLWMILCQYMESLDLPKEVMVNIQMRLRSLCLPIEGKNGIEYGTVYEDRILGKHMFPIMMGWIRRVSL